MWLPKTSSAGLQYRYWRAFANQLVPELTDEPAWPTLRAHLLLLAGDGADPHQRLRAAYDVKEISSADDRAAVLDWRLDDTSLLSGGGGPLSWLPGIPDRIAAKPTWGHTWRPDQIWLLSSPARSASTLEVKHRPGAPSYALSCRPS